MQKKNTCYFIIFLLFFFVIPSLWGQEDLIKNSDFEQIEDNLPLFWYKIAWKMKPQDTLVYMEADDPKSGTFYVTIENINPNDTRMIQSLEVKPNTEYKISCWIMAEINDENNTGASLCTIDDGYGIKSDEYFDTHDKWEYCEIKDGWPYLLGLPSGKGEVGLVV